jgi:UDP-glucose 4-epimerase
MKSDLRLEYSPVRKINNAQRRAAYTVRARKLLGFEARISLKEGLREMVDWWRGAVSCQNMPDELMRQAIK